MKYSKTLFSLCCLQEKTMNNNNKAHPKNGGNGINSYSKNSILQRQGGMIMKPMINEVISDNFDIQNLSSALNTINIADLGCSSGPNTFTAMQNVIEAVKNKYKTTEGLSSENLPEFCVFFNDLPNNDFNTLFTSFPPKNNYFAAGVPGSFHGRLFPMSSLHIVHAAYALHWLSEVPKELLQKDSPAWNEGKIYCSSSSEEVASAYKAQFVKDINNFLNFRATEIVTGGMMILFLLALPDGVHRSQSLAAFMYDALCTSLMNMANEGLISKEQLDTFNLPLYKPSAQEMAGLVERNGCFSIEKVEYVISMNDFMSDIKVPIMHLTAVFEELLIQHFGGEIIDELFHRFYLEAARYDDMDSSKMTSAELFLALKRKS